MIKHIPSLLFSCAVAVVASPTHTRHVDPKAVFAQVIVGNTYNYTPDQWASDIVLASSKGIDAFTLNVGYEVWQPGQVKSAYDAAARIAPNFKLFISLDMSSLACTSSADAQYIIKGFIAPFRSHSQQYIYNSKVLLSTLAGQECTFGEASASAGWQWLINNAGTPIYFIPNLQLRDPVQLRTMWGFIDGYKLWNARPKTNVDNAQRADDAQWPVINNRYLRGDNFQYRVRWQQLIANRDSLSFVEVASWNEYGEPRYSGPMSGIDPAGPNYIIPQNDHRAWADYTWYYANWWKSGAAPIIAIDRVYMWARSHPKNASICRANSVGRVNNADWADDLLFVSVFLKSTAQVYCYSGLNDSGIKTLSAGVNEFTVPLAVGRVGCTVTRNGVNVINYVPSDFAYSTSPTACNMNAWTGLMRQQ